MTEREKILLALKIRMRELLIMKARDRRKDEMVEPYPPPRYDDVYWRGVEWLDSR